MAENKVRGENVPKKNAQSGNGIDTKEASKANTQKSNPLPKSEQEEEALEETQSTGSFFKDRRFHIVLGAFIIIFTMGLLVGFVSYLFTGNNDQSVIESLGTATVDENGKEIENVLGIFGAYFSYVFLYQWFGIASFLFLPIFFLIGLKLVYTVTPFSIWNSIKIFSFYILWISVTLGYVSLLIHYEMNLSYLTGGIGFFVAHFLNNVMGFGTPLFLIFALITYTVFYYNITKVAIPEMLQPGDANTTIFEEETKESNVPIVAPIETSQEAVSPIDAFEADIPELTEEDEHTILDELDAEATEEDWVIEKIEKPIPTKTPEFAFDLPEEVMEVPETPMEEAVAQSTPSLIMDEVSFPVEIPEDDAEAVPVLENFNYDPTLDLSSYKYPTMDLLNEYDGNKVSVTKEELEANKDKIVETLSHYNIGIASIKATIGPSVTLYEIVPDAGIRISKIKNLEDDIALSLAALGIRIIAPIPGKGTIGIEVPNKNKEMVPMRSILSTEKFMKSEKELPIVFGKTISNEVFLVDLAELPHILIAGATGQGKSVGLNVLLASLLYKKHPSQLKLVLVDPKKVELTLFNKIERHFLAKLPDGEEAIITDTKKVIHTLNSLCIEMDLRYDLLKDAQCRNIREYNKKFVERKLNPNNGHRFLPYIVLVIDELADLMMTAGKEVETPIARLAQLARAIGIHLVVATQRPSVNVITGIIKANFPARLSFKVTSKIDSRTILDAGGAEQLIGKGDMLFSHGSELVRIQCAFLDTPEVERICEFIGSQRGYSMAYKLPEYVDEESAGGTTDFNFSDRDPLFEEAARIIVMHQQGSTSLLQRKMKLGYNRAGRLIDQLEAAGVVGHFEGSKAREVLIKDEMSLEHILKGLDGK
jgi:S-DNA-T family DNA segregation ATPase FtsK/SpoIIIE